MVGGKIGFSVVLATLALHAQFANAGPAGNSVEQGCPLFSKLKTGPYGIAECDCLPGTKAYRVNNVVKECIPNTCEGSSVLVSVPSDCNASFCKDLKGELTRMPNGFRENSCNALNMEGQGITSFAPDTFKGFEELKELSLAHNFISDLGVFNFEHLPRLVTLDLTDNKLTNVPGGSLAGPRELTTLILDKNMLGPKANMDGIKKQAVYGLNPDISCLVSLKGQKVVPQITAAELRERGSAFYQYYVEDRKY